MDPRGDLTEKLVEECSLIHFIYTSLHGGDYTMVTLEIAMIVRQYALC